ncbi:hypothetical protein E4T38_07559 [Aureobasidium subglaciale]|nr:hypothetical protein E4T38_07559 [Aureobasidium subglaciale]KAI5217181.1 hypothetical protein E4T40_07528 [Aureobasidium subglaciale]KAI5220468.1 hypothetical protein E4T41_07485 [Aureobasidium subglaciale]KAI5258311.1 hypothetical protein E4T46_07462 [Aureobasidium subglaciale]
MHPSSVLSLVTFSLITNALPNSVGLSRRQDIDFDLVDDTADPLKSPTDTRNYNQASALAAVISDINSDPLPQQETQSANLASRDIVVTTIDGYTPNTFLDSAAINAPLGCNKADTYMGVKLFNTGPFDTTLCAAACTAQTKYNLKHPPSTGKAATCQFYNTYEMYRNDVYQGQYWYVSTSFTITSTKIQGLTSYSTLYTQAWDTTYATNKGQWRGTAHYTIGRSYIASNVTDDGVVQRSILYVELCIFNCFSFLHDFDILIKLRILCKFPIHVKLRVHVYLWIFRLKFLIKHHIECPWLYILTGYRYTAADQRLSCT